MKANLLAKCHMMKRAMHYHEVGFYYWPFVEKPGVIRKPDGRVIADCAPEGPAECGICTNGARLIAWWFNGYVAGYHDFAVVGEYLVDWWAWEYEGAITTPVLRLTDKLISLKYKPMSEWIIYPKNDFRTRALHQSQPRKEEPHELLTS